MHNIERYGGDPDRIYLSGHGMGAHLALLIPIQDVVVAVEGELLRRRGAGAPAEDLPNGVMDVKVSKEWPRMHSITIPFSRFTPPISLTTHPRTHPIRACHGRGPANHGRSTNGGTALKYSEKGPRSRGTDLLLPFRKPFALFEGNKFNNLTHFSLHTCCTLQGISSTSISSHTRFCSYMGTRPCMRLSWMLTRS
jgi:hypothetical protein